jgi:hypothetical protein
MAIWQSDVFFRRIVELILKDIRENPWLVDDILSDFVTDPMLSEIYGQKEIENAKKWLTDNEVSIFLPHRMDLEKIPCITISVGSNTEDRSLARLGDTTPFIDTYQPDQIGQSIPYIVDPFSYTSYDQAKGFFETPPEIDLSIINPGMVAVDPSNGNGYVITDKNATGFFIEENTVISTSQIGVIPEFRIFKARREIATFQERVTIGCHVHGDPNPLLWLYSFMMYGVLRYREGALEGKNFQLSNIETSELMRNQNFESFGENVYSRYITITGQVENTWIKTPTRVIEAVNPQVIIVKNNNGQIPEIIQEECELWVSKDSKE